MSTVLRSTDWAGSLAAEPIFYADFMELMLAGKLAIGVLFEAYWAVYQLTLALDRVDCRKGLLFVPEHAIDIGPPSCNAAPSKHTTAEQAAPAAAEHHQNTEVHFAVGDQQQQQINVFQG